MTPGPAPILAAGCVLWRRTDSGLQVCLVHRPKYDDWSHPKGKQKHGESALDCALREVEEETGHVCTLGPRLPTAHYVVRGRPKQVCYWAAEAGPGDFVPNSEVDAVLWLPPDEARSRLSQVRDRELLDACLPLLPQPRPFP